MGLSFHLIPYHAEQAQEDVRIVVVEANETNVVESE
jgi:hypothetical protein